MVGTSASQRERSDYDATQCFASANCNPWHDNSFADSRLFTGQTPDLRPFRGGFFEYSEHSGWNQYQPFVELELQPTDDLTITPGFKYVWWHHYVNAPLEQKTKPVVSLCRLLHHDPRPALPDGQLQDRAQLERLCPVCPGHLCAGHQRLRAGRRASRYPKAQTTTNYQVGTVYYADNFTFDADIYYIGVENNISFQSCTYAALHRPVGRDLRHQHRHRHLQGH